MNGLCVRTVAASALLIQVVFLVPTALAEAPEGTAGDGDKQVAGMSIVGNDESPKSLVIVPWKGSDLGEGVDVSRRLAQDRSPVDREVFERGLDYYEIRAGRE
jgi:hypothetical protein